ncbi:unnamed protein product [Linum trigynum]|uniref:Anthocyanin acyltransferase n=1 Tax=Linum trigynum TaxID=586398 RepID=A0AAV2GMF9_9ROSI
MIRELIREKYGDLESALLQQWFDWLSTWNYNAGAAPRQLNLSNKVRSTMVITKPNLDKLKARVRSANPEQAHVSTFVVTCALIWVTLIKSEGVGDSSDDPDRVYHLGFSADCRRRLGIELPESFLGNCLGPTFVGEKRGDLAAGGGGFFRAAEAIGRRVREGEWVGAAERWMPTWREVAEGGRVVVIAGSPKLKAYETDFGWGRPRKSAVVQLDSSRSVALCESGDGSGGVEVGLALEENRMEVFAKLFEEFVGQV